MQRHQIIEIREGNKRLKCTVCGQTWTSKVRSACPGTPISKDAQCLPDGY